MSSSLSEARVKVDGQRRAIRLRIIKHQGFFIQHEKDFAAKAIRNCQDNIQQETRRYPKIRASWEDAWKPGDPIL